MHAVFFAQHVAYILGVYPLHIWGLFYKSNIRSLPYVYRKSTWSVKHTQILPLMV